MTPFKEYCQLEESFSKHPGTQYGSNEGGIYTHEPSKRKFYIKFPSNPEQARVEVAAANLYHHLGIKTLEPKVRDIEGRTALVTPWNDDVKPMKTSSALQKETQSPENARHLALMHHAAVITGNLDIVGLEYDNILKNHRTGELVSADQGGAMHFRAMGDHKDFNPTIDKEISGFQNPAYQSGRVFRHLPHDVLKSAATSLDNLTDDKIDSVMKEHGLDRFSNVIKSRRDLLKAHYSK